MKVVINRCYGGFSLSATATQMLAKLQKRKCYIFIDTGAGLKRAYTPITAAEADKAGKHFVAFDIPNPTDKSWDKHFINTSPDDRSDPLLVKVVEKLGKAANGTHAKLEIVEIPDGVQYHIDDYDGKESIHENHRSW